MGPHTLLLLRLSSLLIMSVVLLAVLGCTDESSPAALPSEREIARSAGPSSMESALRSSTALGISVTGVGELSVEPDTARISIGIEVFKATATEARSIAAASAGKSLTH